MTISAVVLTKNEENNIIRCLKSLLWCDEIIVIDDYSQDETLTKIKNYNAKLKILQRELKGDFSAQRNYGLEKTSCDWVLFVDADELISKALASEIKSQISNLKSQNQNLKLKSSNFNGFYIKRNDYFLGRWLKYGETGNIKLLRLTKKNSGMWEGKIHETWKVTGKIGELDNPLLHYPHPTISSFLQKINNYTDLLVDQWKNDGKKIHVWEIVIYPLGKFLQNYFLRLGFLDGIPGLIIATIMSFHSFLVRAKLWIKS